MGGELYKNKYRVRSARHPYWDYGSNGWYFITICTKNRYCHFGHISDGIMHYSTIGRRADQCWRAIPDHFPFVQLGAYVIMPNHVHGIIGIVKPPNNNEYIQPEETQHLASLNHRPNNACHCTQTTQHWSIVHGPQNDVHKKNMDVFHDPAHMPGKTTSVPNNITNIRRDFMNGEDGNEQDYCGGETYIQETQNVASLPSNDASPPYNRSTERKPNTFGPQSKNIASIIRGFKIGVTTFARTNDIPFAWQPRFHDIIIRDQRAYVNITRYIKNNPKKWEQDRFNH